MIGLVMRLTTCHLFMHDITRVAQGIRLKDHSCGPGLAHVKRWHIGALCVWEDRLLLVMTKMWCLRAAQKLLCGGRSSCGNEW
jgi:hypothetical protein